MLIRVVRSAVCAATITMCVAGSCLSQAVRDDTQPFRGERQYNIDLGLAGIGGGYAIGRSNTTSVGASVGVGGNWANYMVLSGRHFAEPRGLSYQGAKDGATNKRLYELVRASVFVRRQFDPARHVDVGLKASAFLHWDSSYDEPGGGTFIGLNVIGTWWAWERIHLGSEIDAGRYGEGSLSEFGVNAAPFLVRVTIP